MLLKLTPKEHLNELIADIRICLTYNICLGLLDLGLKFQVLTVLELFRWHLSNDWPQAQSDNMQSLNLAGLFNL